MRLAIARSLLLVPLGLAAACTVGGCSASSGSSGGASSGASSGGGYSSLSAIDGIWLLDGTWSFICNGVDENETISNAKVYVYQGAFSETQVQLSSTICGVGSVTVSGHISLSGNLTGVVSTNGGNPPLSDTISASCSGSQCSGQTDHTGDLNFTLTNSSEPVFDGATWQWGISCAPPPPSSSGSSPGVGCEGTGCPGPFYATISSGMLSGSMPGAPLGSGYYCDSSGQFMPLSSSQVSGYTLSISGKVDAAGNLTATVSQTVGPTLSFSGSLGQLTGTNGSTQLLAGTTPGAGLFFYRKTP
jgi:hypothetical protein